MFANILSNTLMALSIGAIFTATAPGTLAIRFFNGQRGFSVQSR